MMNNLEIYTSSFKMTEGLFENDILPISIALYQPVKILSLYNIQIIMELQPTIEIFNKYKKYHNIPIYIEEYERNVLANLNHEDIIRKISYKLNYYNRKNKTNFNKVALCCYEDIDKFCHRHLVSEWLSRYYWEEIEEVYLEEYSGKLGYKLISII